MHLVARFNEEALRNFENLAVNESCHQKIKFAPDSHSRMKAFLLDLGRYSGNSIAQFQFKLII